MDYLLFDDPFIRTSLLPLTYSRPIGHIRIGILTIEEKWRYYFKNKGQIRTIDYLEAKFGKAHDSDVFLQINAAVCPSLDLFQAITQLQEGDKLVKDNTTIALAKGTTRRIISYENPLSIVHNVWDIFALNGKEIIQDFHLITKGKISQKLNDPHTRVYSPENIFLEEGAEIRASILNASEGPIYLGKNSVLHEGAIIKGPFALCEGAHVNMGGKIRGDTTVGPYCKVGGEVSNSVLFGYSNKAHDGFLGNSVIGEWCNLGADTNTSNLKNNYGEVEIYNYQHKKFIKTGRQFCGMIMGDHSKAGINTMFNTGTVVGFNANVFGGGFPPKFIPSFSWGGPAGFEVFDIEKSMEVATRVMERRNIPFSATEKQIFSKIFETRNLFES